MLQFFPFTEPFIYVLVLLGLKLHRSTPSNKSTKIILYTDKREFPMVEQVAPTSSTNPSGIELSRLPQLPEQQTNVVLSLQNVRFGWKPPLSDNTGVTLTLEPFHAGNLVMIVGPVGSGKSTFLKGLAGETPVLEGKLFIRYPDLALCEQTPWLANASIRDNIVGENSSYAFDAVWYSAVVRACALELDLQKMPASDGTLVGSKGAKLSGGQKQRIVSSRYPL